MGSTSSHTKLKYLDIFLQIIVHLGTFLQEAVPSDNHDKLGICRGCVSCMTIMYFATFEFMKPYIFGPL
jgi:hypothetical protein